MGIRIESEILDGICNELTSTPFLQLSKHNHLMGPAGVYELQEQGFEHIWQRHIPSNRNISFDILCVCVT